MKGWLLKVDPVLILLFLGLLGYTIILIFVEWRFMQDAQVFQVISNIASGFAGAFFGRMAPDKTPPPTTTTTTAVSTSPPSATVKTEETN